MDLALLLIRVVVGLLFAGDGGYEYHLVVIAAAFAVAGVGSGTWSLDDGLGIGWSSTGWALAALAAGLIGGLGAVISGRLAGIHDGREAPPQPV